MFLWIIKHPHHHLSNTPSYIESLRVSSHCSLRTETLFQTLQPKTNPRQPPQNWHTTAVRGQSSGWWRHQGKPEQCWAPHPFSLRRLLQKSGQTTGYSLTSAKTPKNSDIGKKKTAVCFQINLSFSKPIHYFLHFMQQFGEMDRQSLIYTIIPYRQFREYDIPHLSSWRVWSWEWNPCVLWKWKTTKTHRPPLYNKKTHSPPHYRAVPFEKRNVNPYATYEGESKRNWKNAQWPNHENGTPLSLLFQARSHLPLWKKDSKWWIPPPWSAGSTLLPTLILLFLHLTEQQGSMTTAGPHTSPTTLLLPCVEQHANSPEDCKIYQ